MANTNRTRRPDAEDRAWVAGLVAELGLARAAAHLQLSRLATLNLASGGCCYQSTLLHVQAQRLQHRAA